MAQITYYVYAVKQLSLFEKKKYLFQFQQVILVMPMLVT